MFVVIIPPITFSRVVPASPSIPAEAVPDIVMVLLFLAVPVSENTPTEAFPDAVMFPSFSIVELFSPNILTELSFVVVISPVLIPFEELRYTPTA